MWASSDDVYRGTSCFGPHASVYGLRVYNCTGILFFSFLFYSILILFRYVKECHANATLTNTQNTKTNKSLTHTIDARHTNNEATTHPSFKRPDPSVFL